eukprot:CAMPEP_0114236328 /NCGR_PEP_ID=MMETSP0058-20121206/6782_1 /TAXON_ID=36894 /ORGANISM="Pyramimonas parkeae, CCMP726" /LENGTH=311 /DNA_ID=CAMNT_0001348263 /DNA_START=267 /DNA_END=1202 /DNA_ORIENTATION=-
MELTETDDAVAGTVAKYDSTDIVLPMLYDDGTYTCQISIQGGKTLQAQVDTGSPFLILSDENYEGQGQASGYKDTYERYTSQEGKVKWDQGTVQFISSGAEFGSVVYGVFKTYVNKGGSADVILGLVRNRDDDVRPSFLGQTLIQSVCLDFVSSTLTLSRGALILPGADFVPLVDLRTQFRAPVQHYVVLLQNLVVNDRLVRTSEPIYAMIDTGASGCFITENMFYPLQRQARGWRSMEVDITTYRGETVTLSARRPDPLFLVLPATYPWLPSDANLIVLGLSFLRNSKITLDLLQSKMLLRQFPENPSTA